MTCLSRSHRIRSWLVLGLVLVAAPAFAQAIDFAGEWSARQHEDQPHRNPGPALGDYLGLPINAAVRQKAESWDASILSQPERQSQAHPAQYSLRGGGGPNFRLSKIIDPVSGQLIGYDMTGLYGRADRQIWLDGRPHPPPAAEHLWSGFSTGTFDGNGMTVVTTHMKIGVIQRNGVASSPYGVMTEHFFRHGSYLTIVTIIADPIYLEEPFIRSSSWVWTPEQNVGAPVPFEPVDELGNRPLGWVPHYPIGTHHADFADRFNIPFEATLGGKETTYPDYQLTIAKLREAAKTERRATQSPPNSQRR